jgi:hypothetical protein
MPRKLQIFLLKKKYGDLDQIDWESIVDEKLTFSENLALIEDNYIREIERAQTESGYQTESDKRTEEAWRQHQHALETWRVEQTENSVIHSIEVEISPHQVKVKGKVYNYGRIQACCDSKLVGLKAKITVTAPLKTD